MGYYLFLSKYSLNKKNYWYHDELNSILLPFYCNDDKAFEKKKEVKHKNFNGVK